LLAECRRLEEWEEGRRLWWLMREFDVAVIFSQVMEDYVTELDQSSSVT